MNQKFESGLSNKTIRDMAVVLKQIMSYAGVSFKFRLPKLQKKEIKILSKREQNLLEKEIFTRNDFIGYGILISLYTGLRIGEVCALQWKDSNLDKRLLYVNHTMLRVMDEMDSGTRTKIILEEPKTEHSKREIPISSFLYKVLKDLKPLNKNTYFYLREKIKQVAFSINVNAKYEGVIVDLENTYNLEKNEVVMSKTFRDNYFKGYDIDDEIELIFKYTNAIIPEYTYKTKVIIEEIVESNNNLTNAYISNDLATIIRNTDYLLNFNYFDSFYLNGKEIKDNWELFYSYYDADKAYIIGDLEKEVATFFTTINSDINVLIITMISIIVILIFTVFIDNYYYLNKNKKELYYLYYNGINTNFSLIKLFIVNTISLVIGFILALLINYLYIIILHEQINNFININIKWLCYLLSILIMIGPYILLYILAYFLSKKVKAR